MQLSDKQLATVLAALKYWQDNTTISNRLEFPHFLDVEVMSNNEIDSLCKDLNFETCQNQCCRDHELQANDGLDECLCCSERL